MYSASNSMNTGNEKYKLVQQVWSEEEDWWHWKVWIEAAEKDLNKIEAVEYILHSTFPNPVRMVREKATRFSIQEEGWGSFTIYARVILSDHTIIPLEHHLLLDNFERRQPDHKTAGASYGATKTLPPPAPVEKSTLGKKIAIGAGIAGLCLAVFFLSTSNESDFDYYSSQTDTASMDDHTATAPNTSGSLGTSAGMSLDTMIGTDRYAGRNPASVPDLITNRDSEQGRTGSQKRILRSSLPSRDSVLMADPDRGLNYFTRQLKQKDLKIEALQKEIDSLKAILRR